jgi:hypothetical protein
VRRFEPETAGRSKMTDDEKAYHSGPWITTKPGINRFVWDLRHAGAKKVLGNKLAGPANLGPLVVPGEYQVRLVVGDQTWSQTFTVRNDPRVRVSQRDLKAQLDALLSIRDQITETHEAVLKVRGMKKQLDVWRERTDLSDQAREAATALWDRLNEIEDTLIVPGEQKDLFGLNQPARLLVRLATVMSVISSADARPTESSLKVAEKYTAQIEEQLAALDTVLTRDLADFNRMMAEAGLPAVGA